jgi:hypothetical protein
MARHQRVVVGGDDHGGAEPVQLAQQHHQPQRLGVVEIAGGLVGQQQIGARHHGARNRHPLLLAAGQFGGAGLRLVGQPDPAQHFRHIRPDLPLGPSADAQRQGDVVERRQMRQQAEILEHHADTPAQRRQIAPHGVADIDAEHGQLARLRPDGKMQQPHQAGFAGAGRPLQPAKAAWLDAKADVAQNLRPRAGARAVVQPDSFKADHSASHFQCRLLPSFATAPKDAARGRSVLSA